LFPTGHLDGKNGLSNYRLLDKQADRTYAAKHYEPFTAGKRKQAWRNLMRSPAQDDQVTGQAAEGRSGPKLAERLLAATAHLLGLFSILGIALAACIWLTQRRRSQYVATQARRAVWWQVIAHLVLLALIIVLVVIAVVTFGGALGTTGDLGQLLGAGFISALAGLYLVPVVVAAGFAVMAIVGAIEALRGKNYHYPGMPRQATTG
jgi:uncharacterized Tic20 family protein